MSTLPQAFQNQMKRLLGEAGFFAYEKSLTEPVKRALRVNLLHFPDGKAPCDIEGMGENVPWAKGALPRSALRRSCKIHLGKSRKTARIP